MRKIVLAIAIAIVAAVPVIGGSSMAQPAPPQTGFEQSNGASWTTHEQELDFLAAVDSASDRVSMSVIGTTLQNRPLHLVQIGYPEPHGLEAALQEPTTMFVCSQHGSEPAGREACLKTIRDLAFTTDPELVELLSEQTFLFVPTANPDGRAANTRGNSQGVDINRDHLGLATREARAIAAVVRDWKPDLSVDLHEYGPGTPVLYDDELLYLWPRNLNVEKGIHDLARSYAEGFVAPCAEAAGYTADEYGLDKAGDVQVQQTAGDHDDGIMRNTMGMRNSLGILFETAVTPNPTNNLGEEADAAANQRRRVQTHRTIVDCTFDWLAANGEQMMNVTATAPLRKVGEGVAQNVPVYWAGADNIPATAAQQLYPPPCAYDLTPAQAAQAATAMELHGILGFEQEDGTIRVPLGQAAEPVIPLLLDNRGARNIVSATPFFAPPLDDRCGLPKPDAAEGAAAAFIVLGGLSLIPAVRRRLIGK